MTSKADLIVLLKRKRAILRSRDDLIDFIRYMRPTPDAPDDVDQSLYEPVRHHRAVAAALEKVAAGELKRLIITLPPRHGKTTLASHAFPPWFIGRHPQKSMILATYNEKFSWDFGRAVREIMQQPQYAQVFPKTRLQSGAASVDRLEVEGGGVLFFAGVGSSITGRGGDVILVDDPVKNRKDADSPTFRDHTWLWFRQVLTTRLMTEHGAIVIIMCMTGDTRVSMADGSLKRLDAITPGDMVISWDGVKTVASEVTAVVDNGIDQTYLIRTNGTEVRANERHPFLVLSEGGLRWVRTRDLRRGMRIVAQRKVNTKAFSAQSTDASSRRNVEECAAITTPEQNGFPDQDRHHAPRQSDWSIVASGATALMERTSTDCSGSRAVSAPYAGLMGVLDDLSIGSQISFSTITTKQGSHAAFYATTATELQDELEVPRFWNAPSTTSEIATDVVESVTPFGRERVYDLTVAGTHNFIANGLWTHNTRWHEDDIIGRLTDRHNPYYVADEAAAWQIISLPAIAGLNDLLGRAEGEALWPERFGVDYLDVQRRSDPRGFQALYQGNPTPIDGSFFKSNHFRTYQKMSDLPPIDSLRFYVVSDHAVATAQHNDKTCMIPIGIDGHNHVWVLPDIFWNRSPTDAVVEAMLLMMEKYKPQYWWAEKGHITKSIGPFLRKRMLEKHIYCAIDEIQPAVDKTQRAQAIQARMAMGMVHFPAFARWWSDAQDQMLKFPNGTFDDFVDALSMVGLGLAKQAPRGNNRKVDAGPRPLTLGWIKQQSKNQQREDWIKADLRGW